MNFKLPSLLLMMSSIFFFACTAPEGELRPLSDFETMDVPDDEQWIVEGTYRVHEPNTLMGGAVIFEMTEDSSNYLASQVEHVYGAEHVFSFSNGEDTLTSFEINVESIFKDSDSGDNCQEKIDGQAIISISNFIPLMKQSAGYNKVELVEILDKTPYEYSKICT